MKKFFCRKAKELFYCIGNCILYNKKLRKDGRTMIVIKNDEKMLK